MSLNLQKSICFKDVAEREFKRNHINLIFLAAIQDKYYKFCEYISMDNKNLLYQLTYWSDALRVLFHIHVTFTNNGFCEFCCFKCPSL